MKTVVDCTPTSARVRPNGPLLAPYASPSGVPAALVLDFAAGAYQVDGVSQSDPTVFARLSDARVFASDGILRPVAQDVPRLAYEPVTAAAHGLMIEAASTNLALHSEDVTQSDWITDGATTQADMLTDPASGTAMDVLREDTSLASDHRMYQTLSGITGDEWSFSAFVSPQGRTRVKLRIVGLDASSGRINADFDLGSENFETSSSGTASPDITARMTRINALNDIWRLSVSGVPYVAGGAGTLRANVILLDDTGENFYDGDGVSGMGVWGLQVEAAARPSSYLPSQTVAATRAGEFAHVPLGPWFDTSKGTVIAVYRPNGVLDGETVLSFNDASTANAINVALAAGQTQIDVVSGGTNGTAGLSVAQAETQRTVCAVAYETNNIGASWNGGAVQSNGTATMPAGLTQLSIGRLGDDSQPLNGTLERLVYYPERLSDSDLQILSAG